MKKVLKRYCAPGMMEYHALVYVGRNKIMVSFTGGSSADGCTQPARYETDNIVIQTAIETGSQFRSGRIMLERAEELDEEYANADAGSHTVAEASDRDKMKGDAEGNTALPMVEAREAEEESSLSTEVEGALPAVEAGEADSADEGGSTEDMESAEKVDPAEEGELMVIEVSCKDVAKQYLEDHYGESPTPLRTRADVQECAAKYGITFNFV